MEEKNPYMEAGNSRRSVVVTCALVLAMLVAVAFLAASRHEEAVRWQMVRAIGTKREQIVPGQPLDAVRMGAPSFAEGDHCYRLADRTSGACWWVVKVEGEWRVLPICEGRSYVDQQLEQEQQK